MYVLHKRHTIDVFHIHGGDYVSLFLGWLAHKLSGCRTVLKITSDGWDTPEGVQSGRYGSWIARLYRELDGVVAMSSGQANQVKAWGIGGQLARIPNGVDSRKFAPPSQLEKDSARASLGIAPESPVLVYSGYLSEMKGVDVLVETWNCIRKQCPTSRLILIGNYLDSEKQRTEVSAFLDSKQISPESLFIPEVIHVGVTDTPERFLAAGDVFIFPSRLEGFGTVQIEAMACGLACVVNDLPGLSLDIFPDGETGIRIQDNDVKRFAAAVLDLIRAPEKRIRMGVAARERAEGVFSIERVADRYVTLYQDLLGIEEVSDRP
jgi:glycosyltransferase involved in cell wall biosynthesis